MNDIEWVDVLINAPDSEAVNSFAAELRQGIPAAEVVVSAGPIILTSSPPPSRTVRRAEVGIAGKSKAETELRLADTLSVMGVQVDEGPLAETLDLTVVILN